MIFFTLGTADYPFIRAVDWLGQLLERGVIAEEVLLQYGTTPVTRLAHPLVEAVPYLSRAEVERAVACASLVVSHAGQGSTRMLAERGARFVILPRLKRYGEHIDDHQLLFARAVERLGVRHCTELSQLAAALDQPPPPFGGTLFDAPSLADYLAGRYSA